MVTAQYSSLEQIGDTAGVIWHHLNDHGPRTLSQLAKEVDAQRDVIMQAVGWLAREGKVSIEEDHGKKTVCLRS
ncbi:MAG: winged helix-turn-helix domain-containing protein [Planctomycetia bacterium]|nr:winged helix-turn-helix domain-containing protein [Planctomycetia bacterium]